MNDTDEGRPRAAGTKPRAIFFGTPAFSVPCLGALCGVADVVMVVCQPDRPAGRGLGLTPPAVKVAAEAHGLPIMQPKKVRTEAFAERMRELSADVALVVAYGRILPPAVLSAPRLGCVNVHASLLPKLRGAAPIQWAVVRGDSETGVCLMQMDEGMDTGPVLARRRLAIHADETAGELAGRLAGLGAELVAQELPRLLRGELSPEPQDDEQATAAPVLTKEDGLIDFTRSAQVVHDLVRGMAPWPGAYTFLDGKRVKVHRTQIVTTRGTDGSPGTIRRADRHGIDIACGAGVISVQELQLQGRKRMGAEQFLSGQRLRAGIRLGAPR